MSRLQELQEMLASAHRARKTGKLYVYVQVTSTGGLSRPGEFDIRDGDIIAIRYGQQTGGAALDALAAQTVKRVILMEAATLPGERDAETPDMSTALETLASRSAADLSDIQLAPQALRIFEEVYGTDGAVRLATIISQVNPEQDPQAFLRTCQADVAVVFGDAHAQDMFQPLVDLLAKSASKTRAKKSTADNPPWAEGLIDDAKRILEQVFGVNADAMVEKIANQYPPTRDPIEFLHHCQEEAITAIGKTMARSHFDPIFLKARTIN